MTTVDMSKKSYKVSKWGQSDFDWGKYVCPDHWLDQLAQFIFQHLSDETKNKTNSANQKYIDEQWVRKNIERNIDLQNSNGKRVKEALIKIFAVMTKAVEDPGFRVNPDNTNEQTLVVEKIAEGIENCGQGCENRLNDILRFWQEPRDFAERLEMMRTEIVARYGRALSNETHAQNTVSKIAAKGIFGTKAINQADENYGDLKDKNGNTLNDGQIMTALLDRFNQEYTVLLAIKNIEEQIRSYLITHEYLGKNSSERGYTAVYNQWLDFLNQTLSHKEFQEWLIVDEGSYAVSDINWPLVRTEILNKFINEQFINNPGNIVDMFAILPKNPMEVEYWLSCSPSEEDITKWLLTLNTPHESAQAACHLLSALPEGHPWLETLMSKYKHYMPNNDLDQLRQQWLQTPKLFKNTQFVSRVKKILLSLKADELFAFLCSGTMDDNILSGLFEHQNTELILSSFAILKDNLTEDKLERLGDTGKSGRNALMLAARYQPEAVPELLEAIGQLSPDQQVTIWQQVSVNGYNALMLAAQYQPEAVSKLLGAIGQLSQDQQANILQKTQKNGCNALMLAVQYQPEAVPKLLKAIGQLSQNQQANILQKTQKDGYNALMLAARYQPEAVPELLEAIGQLSPDQRVTILQQAVNGYNALMLATRYQPEAVPELLKAIGQLSPDQQVTIWQQVSVNGYNALMLAAQYQPEAVSKLLEAIGQLPQNQQANILQKTQKYGYNALMLAAQFQPEAVSKLLEVIGQLSQDQRVTILQKTQKDGYNALMLAAQYQSKAVPELLEAIGQLSQDQQANILQHTQKYGYNALMFAAQFQPEAVPKLLGAIGQLSQDQQANILQHTQKDGYNALMFAAQFQPEAVPKLLEAIGQLSPDQQVTIWQKTQKNGCNALMLAVQYQPEAVSKLLEAIGQLSQNQQANILQKTQKDGYNALMLAAQYQPEAVPKLLGAIGQLSQDQRVTILQKTQKDGYNALMLAAQYQSKAVPELLEAIGQLSQNQQANILQKTQKDGYNALMLAAQYQPEAVPKLLGAIGQLSQDQQANILQHTQKDGYNALMLAAQFQPEAVPELLKSFNKLPAYAIWKILRKENSFTGDQLLSALRLMRGAEKTETMLQLFFQYEKKFSPEHWYTIVMEDLLPVERIKHKKEEVYRHIQSVANDNESEAILPIINAALNKDTNIGKFFHLQRGFFSCNERAGTLKKIKKLQTQVTGTESNTEQQISRR